MIAPDNQQSDRTIRLKIKRQDNPDAQSYWQEFVIPYRPNMNVISCLQAIAARPVTADGTETTPVVWDCNCLEEVCGACTMVINGHVRQSCSALVDDLLKDNPVITLEPMTKFPVVRDLFVDRARMFDNLKKTRGWVPIDGLYSLGPGPVEAPADQDVRYALSRCMTCGCCLEVCPQFTVNNDFVGAQVISQVRYFNMHPIGRNNAGERLDAMMQPGGVADCGNAQNCVKVCPKDIPLTESIADVGRMTTVHSIKQFFRGK